MANEVAQWVVLLALGILALGMIRQISLTIPQDARAVTPSGPDVGDQLPDELIRTLDSVLPDWRFEKSVMIAFVAESCAGCRHLLSTIERRDHGVTEPFLIVAKSPSSGFRDALSKIGVAVALDEGELWQAGRVTATPLVVRISGEGRVLAKGVTHRVDHDALASS